MSRTNSKYEHFKIIRNTYKFCLEQWKDHLTHGILANRTQWPEMITAASILAMEYHKPNRTTAKEK